MAAAAFTVLTGCGVPGANAPQDGAANHTTNQVHKPLHKKVIQFGSHARWSQPPRMMIDLKHTYKAYVTTNYGSFTIQLFTKLAPHTVNNFIFLAQHRFYNGDRFFRIIAPYMIQTGDPENNGLGGPGYTFADELPPKYPYAKGIVAMANAGPNTNGSQFFICTGPQAAAILDAQPNYTQFGRVVSGMNVVEKIAHVPVKQNPSMQGEMSSPTKVVYIKKVVIN